MFWIISLCAENSQYTCATALTGSTSMWVHVRSVGVHSVDCMEIWLKRSSGVNWSENRRKLESGSSVSRHALTMLGQLFKYIIEHWPHTSFNCFDVFTRFDLLSSQLHALSSPWPMRPTRPMTMRHCCDVCEMMPMMKSNSFWQLWRRIDVLARCSWSVTSMLIVTVSSNSPRSSVATASSHFWSSDRQ